MFTIVINILISAATPEEAKHDADFDLTSTDDETRELLDLYSILVNVANALAAVCFVLMFAHSFVRRGVASQGRNVTDRHSPTHSRLLSSASRTCDKI